MLHGDLGVDNFGPYTDGQKNAGHKHFIEFGAHLMLMPKDPSSMDGQSTDYTTGAPYVMFKGTPYVHLMIPVNGYYDYQPESALVLPKGSACSKLKAITSFNSF